MPNINRPGVYIEEVSSGNTPVAQATGDSVAVFIGYTDRGPVTGTAKNSFVGKPTLVTGFDDYVAKFSFKTDAFTTIPTYTVTPSSTVTNTTSITITAPAGTTNPAYALYIGSPLTPTLATTGDTVIPAGTYITGISATNQFTVNNPVNVSSATSLTISGTNLPFKYAMQSFFENGGSSAYILRDLPNDADKATNVFRDQNGASTPIDTSNSSLTYLYATAPTSVTLTTTAAVTTATTQITVVGTVTAAKGATISGTGIPDGTTVTNVSSQVLTLSNSVSGIPAGAALTFKSNLLITAASGTPFANAEVGRVVTFTNATATGFTSVLASTNSYVIASVIDSATIAIGYNSGTPIAVATQSTGIVTVAGAGVSAQGTLKVTAIEPGIWGNNIWVGITPGSNSGFFNLYVYYSTATSAASVASAPIESYSNLSMLSSDTNYVVNKINGASKFITVTDVNSTAVGNADLPAFTVGWNAASATTTNGVFSWNASYTLPLASGDSLIKLGVTSTTKSSLGGTTGFEGTAANANPLASVTLPKLDEVNLPLVINYPYKSDTTTINALATYASNRSDSFVVADYPLLAVSGANSTTTADVLNSINQWNTNSSYVATYYPALSVQDNVNPNTTINISPSGAIVGKYIETDATRGVYKAPAGYYTQLAGGYATAIASLPSSDYDLINSNKNNLNIIRYIPGNGYCVMGARTVDNTSSSVRYVSIRRTLGFIEYNLKQRTLFAVFEPNDQNTWNNINSQLSGYLSDLWRSGGLAGTIESQAFYVKCDSTNNTSTSINNGYLNVDIGVALSRPAEFILIRVSQISGSTTVTTNI